MHIEKINDNQIKCILTQRDLKIRELNLSELAYGTEKARSLFHEMLEQAHEIYGFEAENTPLMVEAIPISAESIVLIITRVDNPDELDTRFSRFSPMNDDDLEDDFEELSNKADDILNLFHSAFDQEKDAEEEKSSDSSARSARASFAEHFSDLIKNYSEILEADDIKQEQEIPEETVTEGKEVEQPVNLLLIYSFDSLDTLLELSQILHPIYNGVNSLYKDPADGTYYLTVRQGHHTPSEFNKTCNILSEYGHREKGDAAREAYYTEHYQCIVFQTALQRLYLF